MKKTKKIVALLVAFTALITGCSESYTPKGSVETPTTADVSEGEGATQEEELSQVEETLQESEIKIEINTELLSEFGMTFAELEEKYGKAVSAEVTEGADYTDVLYFFESSSGGYGFVAEETDMSEITLPDGSPQVKEGAEFKYFNGKAENLFLGLEDATTTEEIEKAYVLGNSSATRFMEGFIKNYNAEKIDEELSAAIIADYNETDPVMAGASDFSGRVFKYGGIAEIIADMAETEES